MTPVTTEPRRRPRPPRIAKRDAVAALLAATLGAVLIPIALSVLRLPPHVGSLTIHNPHSWLAHVKITDHARDGWVGLGSIPRQSDRTFNQIPDQGDMWIISFNYAGANSEIQLDRSELERLDWTLTVPDDFARQLRTAGVFETPHDTG
ncbi:MAG: hypothetical protein ACRD29_21030 [Acidimicrobiales bacterium]